MSSILTVSQLNRYLSEKIKSDRLLQGKLVQGEISNFLIHPRSGHMYFTLKEQDASIKCIMFKEQVSRLGFIPENGMYVIVMANVGFYERDGACQLYALDIRPFGAGAQSLALAELKERLRAEGVFDNERKRVLPLFPEKIGVVTAKSGAALQDILNILSRRWPVAEVVLFPSFVQGEQASYSVCAGLKAAESNGCDLVIVGRGGGSSEDLSAFNSEAVVRAVASCGIPVVSAVGHETDVTLCDLAADLRAPTPSAAAEMSVPDKNDVGMRIKALESGIEKAALNCLERKSSSFVWRQKQLHAVSPMNRTASLLEKTNARTVLLNEYIKSVLNKKNSALSEKCAALCALNPMEILKRGYAVAYKDGAVLRSAASVKRGDLISIRMQDGEITASALEIKKSEGI